MAFVEPTVSLPLIVSYILQKNYGKGGKGLSVNGKAISWNR